MTDRGQRPAHDRSDANLERALTDLGEQVVWPSERDLSAGVRARLAATPAPRSSLWSWLRSPRSAFAAGALTAFLLVAAVLLAAPGARDAVADRIGLGGVSITADPTATLPLPLGELGSNLQLGDRTSLEAAARFAGYRLIAPPLRDLGDPAVVYGLDAPGGTQVSYVYGPTARLPEVGDSGVGLLVSQFPGSTNESFIRKQLGADTQVEMVAVHGAPAYWISGEPHVFVYQDANGEFQEETFRLAANVLLWEVDGITVRIESLLPLDQVLPLAESMSS